MLIHLPARIDIPDVGFLEPGGSNPPAVRSAKDGVPPVLRDSQQLSPRRGIDNEGSAHARRGDPGLLLVHRNGKRSPEGLTGLAVVAERRGEEAARLGVKELQPDDLELSHCRGANQPRPVRAERDRRQVGPLQLNPAGRLSRCQLPDVPVARRHAPGHAVAGRADRHSLDEARTGHRGQDTTAGRLPDPDLAVVAPGCHSRRTVSERDRSQAAVRAAEERRDKLPGLDVPDACGRVAELPTARRCPSGLKAIGAEPSIWLHRSARARRCPRARTRSPLVIIAKTRPSGGLNAMSPMRLLEGQQPARASLDVADVDADCPPRRWRADCRGG